MIERRNEMQEIDEVREHCRLVGKRIEKAVADGGFLCATQVELLFSFSDM